MNLYIPTEIEFRDLFKLDQDTRISKSTREQYAKYILGSYLLYVELRDIKEKKPITVEIEGKKEKITTYSSDDKGWQVFVDPLGTRMSLECYYFDKSRNDNTPFWTYTKFGNNAKYAASVTYKLFDYELEKIKGKYLKKYGLELEWKNMSIKYGDIHHPIWLDGCKFMNTLMIKRKDRYVYIKDYEIKDTITNRDNIWTGDILPLVKKIIESYLKPKPIYLV